MLTPAALPAGTTSRDLVRSAIRLQSPARIPYSFNAPYGTDFFELATLERLLDRACRPQLAPGTAYIDEWGVTYRKTRFSWDEVIASPLADMTGLDAYPFPDVAEPARTVRLQPFVTRARHAGKYVVGADPVLMRERVCALMGFEQAMTAARLHRAALESLLDRLTAMTVQALERLADLGVDAFMTWQDHGLQSGPLMRPSLFRELYKPRYARVAAAAHARGIDYVWHSCGQIAELIPDMIEIGVDVIQLDQPHLIGHRQLAQRFGGKVCFWNTVDIQWAAQPGRTAEDIAAEVAESLEPFAQAGGVMVRHYGEPGDIGLPADFHLESVRAFLANGCALENRR